MFWTLEGQFDDNSNQRLNENVYIIYIYIYVNPWYEPLAYGSVYGKIWLN